MYSFKDYWKKSNVKFKRRAYIKKGALDIAPLIDVIFLLLIFFMLTSSFVSQPGIRVNLPKAITGRLLQKKTIVATVTKEGDIFLDNKKITIEELRSQLQDVAKSEQSLLIKADEGTAMGRVVEVWDLCREMGITQVSIATTARKE